MAASSVYAAPGFQRVITGNDTFSAIRAQVPTVQSNVATRADGSMNFTYAGDPYSALRLNNTTKNTTVFQGFQLTADDAKAFAGNKISAVNIVAGGIEKTETNPVSDVTVFITTNISELGYTQAATLGTKAYGTTVVTLDTPYEITGDAPIFIGYYFKCPTSSSAYYVPIDGVPNEEYTMLLATSENGLLPAASSWMSAAPSYGALCLGITISGDKLPENKANIAGVDFPEYMPLTGTGMMNVSIRNLAANAITSVEFTVSGDGFETYTQTVNGLNIAASTLSEPIEVSGFKATKAGFNNLSVSVTKVNGVACESNTVSAEIACYDGGFSRQVVLEDATSVRCGYCPGGIEMLEYAKTK